MIFPNLVEEDENKSDEGKEKYYKIIYTLNLLPDLQPDKLDGQSFMKQSEEAGSDDVEIFGAEAMRDLIDFKWDTYAFYIHYMGAMMHLVYIGCLSIYIYTTFLSGTYGEQTNILYTWTMLFGILYPFIYDTTQLFKSGWDYFKDPWNISDFMF